MELIQNKINDIYLRTVNSGITEGYVIFKSKDRTNNGLSVICTSKNKVPLANNNIVNLTDVMMKFDPILCVARDTQFTFFRLSELSYHNATLNTTANIKMPLDALKDSTLRLALTMHNILNMTNPTRRSEFNPDLVFTANLVMLTDDTQFDSPPSDSSLIFSTSIHDTWNSYVWESKRKDESAMSMDHSAPSSVDDFEILEAYTDPRTDVSHVISFPQAWINVQPQGMSPSANPNLNANAIQVRQRANHEIEIGINLVGNFINTYVDPTIPIFTPSLENSFPNSPMNTFNTFLGKRVEEMINALGEIVCTLCNLTGKVQKWTTTNYYPHPEPSLNAFDTRAANNTLYFLEAYMNDFVRFINRFFNPKFPICRPFNKYLTFTPSMIVTALSPTPIASMSIEDSIHWHMAVDVNALGLGLQNVGNILVSSQAGLSNNESESSAAARFDILDGKLDTLAQASPLSVVSSGRAAPAINLASVIRDVNKKEDDDFRELTMQIRDASGTGCLAPSHVHRDAVTEDDRKHWQANYHYKWNAAMMQALEAYTNEFGRHLNKAMKGQIVYYEYKIWDNGTLQEGINDSILDERKGMYRTAIDTIGKSLENLLAQRGIVAPYHVTHTTPSRPSENFETYVSHHVALACNQIGAFINSFSLVDSPLPYVDIVVLPLTDVEFRGICIMAEIEPLLNHIKAPISVFVTSMMGFPTCGSIGNVALVVDNVNHVVKVIDDDVSELRSVAPSSVSINLASVIRDVNAKEDDDFKALTSQIAKITNTGPVLTNTLTKPDATLLFDDVLAKVAALSALVKSNHDSNVASFTSIASKIDSHVSVTKSNFDALTSDLKRNYDAILDIINSLATLCSPLTPISSTRSLNDRRLLSSQSPIASDRLHHNFISNPDLTNPPFVPYLSAAVFIGESPSGLRYSACSNIMYTKPYTIVLYSSALPLPSKLLIKLSITEDFTILIYKGLVPNDRKSMSGCVYLANVDLPVPLLA